MSGKARVYFVQAETGLIKIGKSENLGERFTSLERQSPVALNVLGITNKDIERELHKRFQDLRHHGEWFRPLKILREFIEMECGVRLIRKGVPLKGRLDRAFVSWDDSMDPPVYDPGNPKAFIDALSADQIKELGKAVMKALEEKAA